MKYSNRLRIIEQRLPPDQTEVEEFWKKRIAERAPIARALKIQALLYNFRGRSVFAAFARLENQPDWCANEWVFLAYLVFEIAQVSKRPKRRVVAVQQECGRL